jgi:endoglucanase
MSLTLSGLAGSDEQLTVVERYGQLKVVDGKLCDHNGNPIQLKGMSSQGLQWFPFTKNTVKHLVNDWGITVVRAAMYTDESGYIERRELLTERTRLVIDTAIQEGIYVVIDWHVLRDKDPNKYIAEAKEFFKTMAEIYGEYPNIIYEICNEPNGKEVTWEGAIKPYAQEVIQVIREIDPDGIIVVGTDTWSQGVRAAADNQLDFDNIMYALHFYAGSHGQWLRDDADYALSKGAGIFVTEWGTTKNTGVGDIYEEESQKWIDWMAKNKISWCNWSMSFSYEDNSALLPGTGLNGPWPDSKISDSGLWVRERILAKD